MASLKSYFVSDVHLGLQVADPADREVRFVNFLRGLPQDVGVKELLTNKLSRYFGVSPADATEAQVYKAV